MKEEESVLICIISEYTHTFLCSSVTDPKFVQAVSPTTSVPLQQEQHLIGESMSPVERSEQQKSVETEEPSLQITSGSIASDPILQNSLMSVVKLGTPEPLQSDREEVEFAEMRSKSPNREGSVHRWQMSDSSDDDLGIEAEVKLCLYMYCMYILWVGKGFPFFSS